MTTKLEQDRLTIHAHLDKLVAAFSRHTGLTEADITDIRWVHVTSKDGRTLFVYDVLTDKLRFRVSITADGSRPVRVTTDWATLLDEAMSA